MVQNILRNDSNEFLMSYEQGLPALKDNFRQSIYNQCHVQYHPLQICLSFLSNLPTAQIH